MITKELYHRYLLKRNPLSFLYRILFIYLKLSRHCSGKILDIGCGIGDFVKFASVLNKNVIGLDVSYLNILYLKDKGYPVQLMRPDKLTEYENEEFQTVILDNVIEHIKNPNKLLDEITRVTKKNSKLIIGIPVGEYGYSSDPDHKKYYDEQLLEKKLNLYNFSLKHSFYSPIKSLYLRQNLKSYCYYAIYVKKN